MSPCSRCASRGLSCIVSSDSRRCSECTRSNVKCNVAGPSLADWAKLHREEERLTLEEEQTYAKEKAARQAADEAFAKIMRLRKQKKLLKEHGSEMLRHGLQTLDELE